VIVWNHPGFMGAQARWFPHIEPLHEANLIDGVEVVNGDQFYPEALEWTREKSLTAVAASDAHLPMPAHLKSARRPVTLVFAKTRDLAGVKEALAARRTLAWLDTHVWGSEHWLATLWGGAVSVEPVSGTAGREVTLTLRNSSAIDYDIEVVSAPAWLAIPAARIAREGATSVRARLAPTAPSGTHDIRLRVRVANLQSAGEVPLDAGLNVTMTVQ
jgi:hypothetical protein